MAIISCEFTFLKENSLSLLDDYFKNTAKADLSIKSLKAIVRPHLSKLLSPEPLDEETLESNLQQALRNYLSSCYKRGRLKTFDDLRNPRFSMIIEYLRSKGRGLFHNDTVRWHLFMLGAHDMVDFSSHHNDGSTDTKRYLYSYVNQIDAFTHDNSDLLIIGETGTSKELIAKAIHFLSNRKHKPYFAIDIGSLPENQIESTIFGHVKGAYTGADKDRPGLLEESDGGSILLDELGKLPSHLQAKLLRVIQEKVYYQMGSDNPKKIDVRFICTLQPYEVSKLLPDLKYRLGYPDVLVVPSLKDRLHADPEIPIQSALKELQRPLNYQETINFDKRTIEHLNSLEYPGNYRQLINILRFAVRSAKRRSREQNDITIILDDFKGLPSIAEQQKTCIHCNPEELNRIRMVDIIAQADKIGDDIIKTKIMQIQAKGKDVKTVHSEECPRGSYESFYMKIQRRIGKFKDLK